MLRIGIFNHLLVKSEAVSLKAKELTVQITHITRSPFHIQSYKAKVLNNRPTLTILIKAAAIAPELQTGRKYLLHNAKLRIPKLPKNPGDFNYKAYLNHQGISHELRLTKKSRYDELEMANPLLYHLEKLKRHLAERNIAVFGIEKGTLINGFILGLKREIPKNISNAFKNLGISHLLAVSGLHIGFIVFLLFQLLAIFRLHKSLIILFLLLFLIFYSFFTGMSPSVTRAALMTAAVLAAPLFQRQVNIINSLCAAAFFLLLINPANVFNVGFQFSFSAVLGIIFIYSALKKRFSLNSKNVFIRYSYEMLLVSVAASIITMPVSVYYFQTIQLLSVFLNILVIPLTFIIIATTVLSLPFLFWNIFPAVLIVSSLDFFVTLFLEILKSANAFSFWTIHVESFAGLIVIIVSLLVILLVIRQSSCDKFKGKSKRSEEKR